MTINIELVEYSLACGLLDDDVFIYIDERRGKVEIPITAPIEVL